jgi:hypothetical protein
MYRPTILEQMQKNVPGWHPQAVSNDRQRVELIGSAQSMVNSRDVPKVGKSAKGSGPRAGSTYRGKRRNARRLMRAEQLRAKRGNAE